MTERQADLIIFDCDGVLVDSEILSADVLIEALARLGARLTRDDVRTHFLGRSFPTVAGVIRDMFDIRLPDSFEADYRSALLARFETELHPTPGLAALLPSIAVAKCVATSSSPPRVARTLEISGLAEAFGANVFTASLVARGKPAPDLFLFAARKIGVPPNRTLVIEDSAPGLAAGQAAGMQVVQYTGGSHLRGLAPPGPEADAPPRFDSWDDFAQMFPSLVSGGH